MSNITIKKTQAGNELYRQQLGVYFHSPFHTESSAKDFLATDEVKEIVSDLEFMSGEQWPAEHLQRVQDRKANP